MRILITNDDGIDSPILPVLARRAMELGEVTVIAPKVEQSGKSVGLELRKAFRVEKVEDAVNIGDEVLVKIIEIDDKGRINLSRKDALADIEAKKSRA